MANRDRENVVCDMFLSLPSDEFDMRAADVTQVLRHRARGTRHIVTLEGPLSREVLLHIELLELLVRSFALMGVLELLSCIAAISNDI